jgi:alkylation response protein AidB-like acyl-CoA dehydrogenase
MTARQGIVPDIGVASRDKLVARMDSVIGGEGTNEVQRMLIARHLLGLR